MSLFFRSPSLTCIRLFEVVWQHWFSVVFVLVFLSFFHFGLFLLLYLQVHLPFLQCTFWFRYFTFHFQKFDMDVTFHVSLWHAVFYSTWANEVSLQQHSHQVVFSSLQPHGLQHTRFPCPSLSLRVCPHSCPLNQWCHLTITSSAAPFSPPALHLS